MVRGEETGRLSTDKEPPNIKGANKQKSIATWFPLCYLTIRLLVDLLTHDFDKRHAL